MNNERRNSLIVLGLFTMASIALLFYLSLKVGGLDVEDRDIYFVEFEDATGLVDRAAIKIAGITVGTVGQMTLTPNYRARVELKIDKGVPLYNDAIVSIRAKSLLGEMFIGIKPGTEAAGRVQSGETIRDAREPLRVADLGELIAPLIKDVDPKAFSQALSSVADFLAQNSDSFGEVGLELVETVRSIGRIVRGNEDRVNRILSTTDRGALTLVKLLDEHGGDIGKTIDSLVSTTQKLERLIDSFDSLTTPDQRKNAINEALELMSRINRLSQKLEQVDWNSAAVAIKKVLQEEGIHVSVFGYEDKELRDQLNAYPKVFPTGADVPPAPPGNAPAATDGNPPATATGK